MIPHAKPVITHGDIRAVRRALEGAHLSDGSEVCRFEQAMARTCGVKHGVAVSSGTAALHLALLALGVRENDEVIIPSYVCPALVNAVLYLQAIPVIVDIETDGFHISFTEIKKKMTRHTKVVIIPTLFGAMVDWKIFKTLSIPIIEDCTQSLGATYDSKPAGSFGTLAVASFYATKYVTSAEGGMVLGHDAGLLGTIEDLRSYDNRREYKVRYNYKLSDLHAALGRSQLARLARTIRVRNAIAQRYDRILADSACILPHTVPGSTHVFYRYVITLRTPRAEALIKRLHARGIDAKRPVFRPLHQYFTLHRKSFSNTERAHASAVSLPMYPTLTKRNSERIAKETCAALHR